MQPEDERSEEEGTDGIQGEKEPQEPTSSQQDVNIRLNPLEAQAGLRDIEVKAETKIGIDSSAGSEFAAPREEDSSSAEQGGALLAEDGGAILAEDGGALLTEDSRTIRAEDDGEIPTVGVTPPPRPDVVRTGGASLRTPPPIVTSTAKFTPPPPEDPPAPEPETIATGDKMTFSRESTSNCLKVEKYAEAIASLFKDIPDEEAFSMGVFSPWGRGKTHLMKKVASKLEKEVERPYRSVPFNAWKYRTTTEIWAYLYETLRESAAKESMLLPLWAGLAKHGLRPSTIAMAGLCFALITTSQKVQLVATAFQIFGLSGMVYGIYVYTRSRTLAEPLAEHYTRLIRHDDKLGLQAALGSDLRNLMVGWIPREFFKRPKTWETIYLAALHAVLSLVIALQLWAAMPNEKLPAADLQSEGLLFSSPTRTAVYVVIAIWVAVSLLLPLVGAIWLQRRTGRTQRVLLIIDDLDRCPPLQMLDVVESVALLLDDEEVNRRVQVAILADEDALRQAIAQKYKHIVEQKGDAKRHGEISRLTRETMEKLLLVHLRLPRLVHSDVHELLDKYLDEIDGPQQPTENSNPGGARAVNGLTDDPPLPKNSQTLSDTEKQAFRNVVNSIMEDADGQPRLWGPRAIRALIFRYQLARLLLKATTGALPEPRHLIDALLNAKPDLALPVDADLLTRIAWQVA
mgnify:CR=1 FL=1